MLASVNDSHATRRQVEKDDAEGDDEEDEGEDEGDKVLKCSASPSPGKTRDNGLLSRRQHRAPVRQRDHLVLFVVIVLLAVVSRHGCESLPSFVDDDKGDDDGRTTLSPLGKKLLAFLLPFHFCFLCFSYLVTWG